MPSAIKSPKTFFGVRGSQGEVGPYIWGKFPNNPVFSRMRTPYLMMTMAMMTMMMTIRNHKIEELHAKAEPNWNFIAFSTDLPAHHTNTISFGWATIMVYQHHIIWMINYEDHTNTISFG